VARTVADQFAEALVTVGGRRSRSPQKGAGSRNIRQVVLKEVIRSHRMRLAPRRPANGDFRSRIETKAAAMEAPLTGLRDSESKSMNVASSAASPKRDPRIDVLRGIALLMIFIDHIPGNVLSVGTLHNFGFSDAAEIFVLLAGMSAMLAYSKTFEREGVRRGLRRVFLRCAHLYVFQVGLLLTTLGIVTIWTTYYEIAPTIVRPILSAPVAGLMHGVVLHAVPDYLNILPLYFVLHAAFPLVYFGLRLSRGLALGLSATLWLAANLDPNLNLPNWMDGGHWFFNPFAWQFLFTIGAALAVLAAGHGGTLPRAGWVVCLCAAYLSFAFLESAPWADWHLPDLRPFAFAAPDETRLSVLRLLDILALTYLVFSSAWLRVLAVQRIFRPLASCGRHSLEVFAVGCILALLGRLLFRTHGAGLETQIAVNVMGIAMMVLVGMWFEKGRMKAKKTTKTVTSRVDPNQFEDGYRRGVVSRRCRLSKARKQPNISWMPWARVAPMRSRLNLK
jgi:hypothetical protein